jgi:hypothetical protein
LLSPQSSEYIPDKRSAVRFVIIATFIFKVMPDAAIDITMEGDAFFPIPVTVFPTAILILFGYIEKHIVPAAFNFIEKEVSQYLM